MNLPLAKLSGRATYGDILHGAAKTAVGMTNEVSQDKHGVIIGDIPVPIAAS